MMRYLVREARRQPWQALLAADVWLAVLLYALVEWGV